MMEWFFKFELSFFNLNVAFIYQARSIVDNGRLCNFHVVSNCAIP